MAETKSSLASYVENNSTPLTAGNYNDVDALVFAELSYCKFETAYAKEGYADKTVTVQQFAKDMIAANPNMAKDEREFLTEIARSERYADCEISNLAAENVDSQWAAMTVDIKDGTDTAIIAMRGTDSTELGWAEDMQLAYDIDGTNAQLLSAEYLKNCDAKTINLTGHSKGGSDVMSAYAMVPESVRDSVARITNFDGPGMNVEFQEEYAEGYAELGGKLHNYYPENTVIGQFLTDNPGEKYFVPAIVRERHADKGILGEHDGFSFQIKGNKFKTGEQSMLSKFLDDTLDATLADLSNEERAAVMELVIEKYNIPAMIAGEGETPFSDNKAIVDEALDLWLVPDFIEDGLEPGVLAAYNVIEGISIYCNASEEEKEAARETISLILTYGASEAGEIIGEKVDELTGEFKEGANRFANWISDRAEDLADGLNDLADNVEKTVYSWGNDFKEWIEDKTGKNDKPAKKKGAVSGGGKAFCVKVSTLRQGSNQIKAMSTKIDQYYESVDAVQDQMHIVASALNAISFMKIKNQMVELAENCTELSEALDSIAEQYATTEKRIVES